MERADINGTSLEFEVQGDGEPVVLLHPGIIADGLTPLMSEPALAGRYRLIHYHRRGYAGSARATGPVSTSEQAEDCRALLRHLGVEQAHVVGHSYGGTIALQLALDAPAAVLSLALLEPLVPAALTDPAVAKFFMDVVGRAFELYGAGDKAGAIDTWARGAFGPGYRAVLDCVLPGAFEQAVADADTVFQVEAPAVQQWSFTPADAARITIPALSVVHEDPIWAGFQKTHELLLEWLPQAEGFVLPDATHLLQIMNPSGMAAALVRFLDSVRHRRDAVRGQHRTVEGSPPPGYAKLGHGAEG